MTKTISAIILAKNAESDIIDCLDSVSFCDERIVVLDSHSTDRTEDLAKRAGARVIKTDTSNFSERRNTGLEAAKGEWVFYIDTDESVTPVLRDAILATIKISPVSNVAYKIKRKNFYLGKHEWPAIEKLERLFFKNKLKKWKGTLNESPIVDGNIGELDGFLEHYTHKNLKAMLDKTIQWSEVEAKLRLDAHHPKMTC